MKKNKSTSEGNGSGGTPTQEATKQITKQLMTQVKTAKSQKVAAKTALKAAKKNYSFDACCYTKSTAAYQKYWEVDNCVTTAAAQDMTLLKTNIDAFIKDSDDLKKHFKEVVKKVKETKAKLTVVKDATCKLSDCLDTEERCNPNIYDALIEGINDGQNQLGLVDALSEISSTAKETQETSCVTFDATIKISGIQTFSNIGSLKTFGEKLIEKVTTLKKNVDENLKSNTDSTKKAQEALTNSLNALSTATDGKHTATNVFEGQKKTKMHLRNMECESVQDNQNRLEEICEAVKNFSSEEERNASADEQEEKEMWE